MHEYVKINLESDYPKALVRMTTYCCTYERNWVGSGLHPKLRQFKA